MSTVTIREIDWGFTHSEMPAGRMTRLGGEVEELAGNIKVFAAQEREVQVAEEGDRVTVELHRGGDYNKDGIMQGGEWITKTGTVAAISEVDPLEMTVAFDDGDKQNMSREVGADGYPYRNLATA